MTFDQAVTLLHLVVVGTLVPIAVAVLGLRKRLEDVHVLVNSRLTEALREIKRLGGQDEEF